MTHYTHMCMNCGPERPTGVAGAPTTMIDGRCERCGSEAITPIVGIVGRDLTVSDDAARLAALEIFHEEIVREKDTLIVLARLDAKELRDALAAYRANHPKCVLGGRRCRLCRRADALLVPVRAVGLVRAE